MTEERQPEQPEPEAEGEEEEEAVETPPEVKTDEAPE